MDKFKVLRYIGLIALFVGFIDAELSINFFDGWLMLGGMIYAERI